MPLSADLPSLPSYLSLYWVVFGRKQLFLFCLGGTRDAVPRTGYSSVACITFQKAGKSLQGLVTGVVPCQTPITQSPARA